LRRAVSGRRIDERDACGIGFVADARGRPSTEILQNALEALCRVRHRGAVAADARTGDGAGVLVPIPTAIVADDPTVVDGTVGERRLGMAMVFLDPDDPAQGRSLVASACSAESLDLAAWRSVPVNEAALGDVARESAPIIEQAILLRPHGGDDDEAERSCFRVRRRIEAAARAHRIRLYVASISFQTVTYKALCAADQLANFYDDLTDGRFEAWFAIFHQRYSTNTSPSWERAQPFRFLAHNGEINTVSGNAAWMRAREGDLGADRLAPPHLLAPVIDPDNSDSGMLDEVMELLVRGGRGLSHAAAMLIPCASVGVPGMPEEVRAFYRYHSCLIEPWDGPAALVFSDGKQVAAALDRNGLRPLRVAVCEDGLVACASEAGAVPTEGRGLVRRTRLGPGGGLLVDPSRGVMEDLEVKKGLARQRPYGRWLSRHLQKQSSGEPVSETGPVLGPRQVAAGVTKEELTAVIRPMATGGQEPTSSMGDDTAQPPLAQYGRLVFGFLKQRFAQVTNPPIDHLRERHVMSITTRLGSRAHLLDECSEAAAQREYESFVLFPSAVSDLQRAGAVVLDATFDVGEGPDGLAPAVRRLARRAQSAVSSGARVLIVSDRSVGPDRVVVPSALAAGAVHHGLLDAGLRTRTSLVVDADDPRETHHFACLLTNGADAVCPRLVLELIHDLSRRGRLGGGVDGAEAQRLFVRAVEDGVLKIMSKMGISTLDSYRGAQIIEAIGLGPDVIGLCFSGVASAIGGLDLLELGADAVMRHDDAFAGKSMRAGTGFIKHKSGGEYHAINPDVTRSLHEVVGLEDQSDARAAHELRRAVAGNDSSYARFAALVNERPPTEPRDLLDFLLATTPVPLDDVEPASEIVKRFSTGAMSHGALSAEAHETLSMALNVLGGKANTGEGGEAPERYRDRRNSSIKQVASGRFGVTPEYIAFAEELQIKMAQGSKPGEGGQIPGSKVTTEIARLRHTVAGVALISPPPHHDIYSIEDLAQLIFDLKQANPRAPVSVKLVSSEGVGTIAAGVVKGLADVVHIAGADGGTGASPLSSIKHAGMPWEVGLAETQAALSANGLRGRVRLRVDGGLKTGRDVVMAALLGADEFSFGTAVLIAEGCILVRTCHRNTCPVGIATQDPELRKKFAATPEMVARYLLLVAEEVRSWLSTLGFRSLDEVIGRTDLLRARTTGNPRFDSLDLSALLADAGSERRSNGAMRMPARSSLGDRLYRDGTAALRRGRAARLTYPIDSSERAVGARLGCALGYELNMTKPAQWVRASFHGQAGQSFGAFLADGIELVLVGEANDYVCKGMGGGRVVIRPPTDDAGDPVLAGNTVLYGATAGQLYIAGRAGERFAVRNSGAVAVVEGTGDHACEYMTAGAVVILGRTGINLGAGMSGGEVYVYDPDDRLEDRLNRQLVAAYEPTVGQLESLRRIIRRHGRATGSHVAAGLLGTWASAARNFKRVAPVAEVARLEALFEGTAAA
jgi:glutamate synthase domain-containing protein 2/glutamate synthase domain-containing protein 1/glutamate synthase domain-containing protein 3